MPVRDPEDNRTLSILIIGPSPDILGGQSVQLLALAGHLMREPGFRITFLPMNPRLPKPLCALQRIKYVRTVVTFLWFMVKLSYEIRAHPVVHIFSAAYWSFVLAPLPAVLLARALGKKIILHYHDGRAAPHLRRSWLAVRVMRLADRLVTPSRVVAAAFESAGMAIKAIPNTIEIASLPFRERAAPRPVFLHNRILEPLYNVGCTLRAFAIIQQFLPGASLIVANDGVCRPALMRLAAELKLRNVSFIGRVPHERSLQLYDEADIYLSNSDYDCMPVSVLECFAAGMPVVTTAAGGIVDMVTHEQTGLLSPCGDPEALAANALRLLREPGLALRLTTEARRACSQYAWANIREQWLALYSEVAGSLSSGLECARGSGHSAAG